MTFLTHLECGYCGLRHDANRVWNLCRKCERPLLARYDMAAAREALSARSLAGREDTLWRYHEMLPVRDASKRTSLGEGWTPLRHAPRLGASLQFDHLYIKDESLNPTTSFKARGLALAISKAHELGITSVSIPSAGNAAGAMCAYAAVAGMQAYVYMPEDVPQAFIAECQSLGGNVTLVKGFITDCGRAAAKDNAIHNRFSVATLKEPYRLEGKKTMGYEVAEQMNWELPGVIIYPTGGGTGLIGMWKAFDEMEALGWIDSRRPRMVSVQSATCAPIVKAFQDGSEFADPWPDPKTIADGLRVPSAVGDFLMLRAIRESNGTAVAVDDDAMMEACDRIGAKEGIFAAPEGGATLVAFETLWSEGWIGDTDRVLLFNTGSGHKYAHLWKSDLRPIEA